MLEAILTGTGIVTGLGLVCGVLLAVAGKYMSVKTDETYEKIRGALPGANCGACGYTGCDGYAKAVREGKAATNLCVPGADAVARELAAITGTEFRDVIEQVAFVRCSGSCGAVSEKQTYQGVQTCQAANMIYGGTSSCTYGCLGYGDCAAVCPQNAICVRDGVARVDTRLCIGCGLCVKACPNHLIVLVPDVIRTIVVCSSHDKGAAVRKKCLNGCIGCKKCENNCPEGAIKVVGNLAEIDYEKCTGCGICVSQCPVKCIHIADFSGIHRQKDEKE